MEGDTDDSVDEELEESLPICVQGSLTRLRSDKFTLSTSNKTLRRQLEESRLWSRELEGQVRELKDRVADLENKLSEETSQCQRLQVQLDEVGERLGSGQLSFTGDNQDVTREEAARASVETQTESLEEGEELDWSDAGDIVKQVTSAANSVMEQQGMVYEETSGLWYDFKSRYYFDPGSGLYYDGHNGVWYQYNSETKQYTVNSRVPEEEVRAQKILSQAAREAMEARAKKEEGRKKRRKSKDQKEPDLVEALDSLNSVVADHDYSDEEDDPRDTIPCVRIVVTGTEDPEVVVGSLFLVTCKGGSIGSRGHHEVLLGDKGCSKHHARISYSGGKYYLRDLGSRNGTWVAGKRISVSKQESEDIEIGHGTLIQIGKTKLRCCLHPGRETCLQCEPGLVREEVRDSDTGNREERRRENIKSIKRKYGLDNPGEDNLKPHDPNFHDRAKERRRLIGSTNGSEKTVSASVDTAIGTENKGFKMLTKMGYKGGNQGLGKHNQGRAEPVKVEQRTERAGLGSHVPSVTVDSRKNAIWRKTQKRFTTTSVLDAFNQNDTDEDGES